MDEEELKRFLAALEAHRKAHSTKEAARAYLIANGFINPDGGLTERYGGKPARAPA